MKFDEAYLEMLKGKKRWVYDEKNYSLSDGKTTYKLGQKVRIKVLGVNLGERRAEFEMINHK